MIQQLEQIIINYDLHHIDTFQIIQLCQKYDLYIVTLFIKAMIHFFTLNPENQDFMSPLMQILMKFFKEQTQNQ